MYAIPTIIFYVFLYFGLKCYVPIFIVVVSQLVCIFVYFIYNLIFFIIDVQKMYKNNVLMHTFIVLSERLSSAASSHLFGLETQFSFKNSFSSLLSCSFVKAVLYLLKSRWSCELSVILYNDLTTCRNVHQEGNHNLYLVYFSSCVTVIYLFIYLFI